MFRKFSLFDSSPPPAKISIAPPRPPTTKSQRKSPIKCAIISSLQLQNSPEFTPNSFFSKQAAKRSKSLDHSNEKKQVFNYHNAYHNVNATRSSTLPTVIRELPQSPMTTTCSWYSRLGNSFRRGTRRGFQYQVIKKVSRGEVSPLLSIFIDSSHIWLEHFLRFTVKLIKKID